MSKVKKEIIDSKMPQLDKTKNLKKYFTEVALFQIKLKLKKKFINVNVSIKF